VVLAMFAFELLDLHRLEICIVPRNANSRRVMDKLGLRDEGIAARFLEINGVWEDHVRYGFTVEEWEARRDELADAWL
jgi:ribosomal-protein-alanine N-acetyltransferase